MRGRVKEKVTSICVLGPDSCIVFLRLTDTYGRDVGRCDCLGTLQCHPPFSWQAQEAATHPRKQVPTVPTYWYPPPKVLGGRQTLDMEN